MKIGLKWLTLVCLIILCLGVSGCIDLNLNGKVYGKAILTYLSDKYEQEFVIENLYEEFSGDTGVCVRAICRSKQYKEKFVVYCYVDDTVSDEKMFVDGKSHAVVDTFYEVYLQNKLLEEFKDSENENTLIKCKVAYNKAYPTKNEFEKGLNYCLSYENFTSYIKVYIFSEDINYAKEQQKKINDCIKGYEPYYSCVFCVEMENVDKTEIETVYEEKYDSFSNYIANSEFAKTIDYIECDAKKGTEKTIIMKE